MNESSMHTEAQRRHEAKLSERRKDGTPDLLNVLLSSELAGFVEALRIKLDNVQPGVATKHVRLIQGLSADVVAWLSLRALINNITLGEGGGNHRTIAYAIGTALNGEILSVQFKTLQPGLYYTLLRDFQRRKSKSDSHRLTAWTMLANKSELGHVEWPHGARDQIGLIILGWMEELGVVVIEPARMFRNRAVYRGVHLNPAILTLMDSVDARAYRRATHFQPLSQRPADWVSVEEGGFHSDEMRRCNPFLIRTGSVSREACGEPGAMVLAAVNRLQDTAWRVHDATLSAVQSVLGSIPPKELLGAVVKEVPPRPDGEAAIRVWKEEARQAHESRELSKMQLTRLAEVVGSAVYHQGEPVHFVHFLDSRGRAYALSQGINPQGNDLARGLLCLSHGEGVSPAGKSAFLLEGSARWGCANQPRAFRERWVHDNLERIWDIAQHPERGQWLKADSPVMFLQWCIQFTEWAKNPQTPVSLATYTDGTCNGLQHLAAMSGDADAGREVNMGAHGDSPADAYTTVAEVAMRLLSQGDLTRNSVWLRQGIPRKVAKVIVMPLPYGLTRMGARESVRKRMTLAANMGEPLVDIPPADIPTAATEVVDALWQAVHLVFAGVMRTRQALTQYGRKAVQSDDFCGTLSWETPSGFTAAQTYFQQDSIRVPTAFCGVQKIRVAMDSDEPHFSRSVNAFAPNYVHSMDAAHMHRIVSGFNHPIGAIHDAFAVHANNRDNLQQRIRSTFVEQYASSPLHTLPEWGGVTPYPSLHLVLENPFFFS